MVDYGEDFINRIVAVHWPKKEEEKPPEPPITGGAFSFAGSVILDVVTLGTDTSLGYSEPHFTWLGGTSLNGRDWRGSSNEAGLALNCCVRGKVGELFITVAAGGVTVGPVDHGPGYSISYGAEPAAGISYDNGLSWGNAGLPLQQFILKPPNPNTGAAADTARGGCNAVAYHSGMQAFFVGGQVQFSVGAEAYIEDRVYSVPGGSQVFSRRRDMGSPFEGYPWPAASGNQRLYVADRTGTTPAGGNTIFVASFHGNQLLEHITADGSVIMVSKETVSAPLAVINSVTSGQGYLVAVGWEDENERTGPVTFVHGSSESVGWVEQLSGLTTTSPALEDKDGGSTTGSCSFS